MFETIAIALLPAVITVVLGYVAARRHDFVPQDASVLIKMVMSYALPLSLFVGTVHTPRAALLADAALLAALFVAIVGLYVVVFAVARHVFHYSLGASALGALAASAPNFAFIGPPVLGNLYGPASNVPIAVGNTLILLTVFPATVVLLSLEARDRAAQTSTAGVPDATPPVVPAGASVADTLLHALAKPIVWLPLIGIACVLLDVRFPSSMVNALDLLGQSATGVALFSAGIVISAYKLEMQPPGRDARFPQESRAACATAGPAAGARVHQSVAGRGRGGRRPADAGLGRPAWSAVRRRPVPGSLHPVPEPGYVAAHARPFHRRHRGVGGGERWTVALTLEDPIQL